VFLQQGSRGLQSLPATKQIAGVNCIIINLTTYQEEEGSPHLVHSKVDKYARFLVLNQSVLFVKPNSSLERDQSFSVSLGDLQCDSDVAPEDRALRVDRDSLFEVSDSEIILLLA
jgi:hypothetical protein